jgi:glycosyltransferase involved in cell wall biosynthesis
MSAARRAALRVFVRGSATRCDRIITLSDFSKTELVRALDVAAEKITRVYCAPRTGASPAARTAGVVARYAPDAPYVVAFSSQSAHKNIGRLVQAFARLETVPHRLIIAGHAPREPRSSHRRIVFTGYVPDGDVLPLIAGADLFVFPSLYEGFGLPLLDAQAVGTPAACSNIATLREIGGTSVASFDGTSVESMRECIGSLLESPAERSRLSAAGLANAARFSWRAAATETIAVYRRALGP